MTIEEYEKLNAVKVGIPFRHFLEATNLLTIRRAQLLSIYLFRI